ASDPAGYLLDADGGIHPFGGAPAAMGNTTWPGKGIARALVLSGGSTRDAVMGYTLDGFGGIHPFGGARELFGSAEWPADMAAGCSTGTVMSTRGAAHLRSSRRKRGPPGTSRAASPARAVGAGARSASFWTTNRAATPGARISTSATRGGLRSASGRPLIPCG